jgi:hypothetical protein
MSSRLILPEAGLFFVTICLFSFVFPVCLVYLVCLAEK